MLLPLRDWLLAVALFSGGVACVIWLLYVYAVKRRAKLSGYGEDELQKLLSPLNGNGRKQIERLYGKCYEIISKTPGISRYTQRIRRRIAPLYSYDESVIRMETGRITLLALLIGWLTAGFVFLFYPDVSYMLMILLGSLVLHGILIDTLVHRAEDRLFRQMTEFLSDVRHFYHQHGMVDEAVYDAAQIAPRQLSLHADAVYGTLTSDHPESSLEIYYEHAPNRFLKSFAGVSFLVREFGDKLLPHGSMYLHALSKITSEIRLEILRKEKLHYLLKGLSIIAISPILAAKPIETWARNNFPAMDEFYTGAAGFAVKTGIFVLIIVCFVLLRKLQDTAEEAGKRRTGRRPPEQKWLGNRFVNAVTQRFVPAEHSMERGRLQKLLREANSPLLLEWLTLRRLLTGLACFLLVLGMFLIMQRLTLQQVYFSPTRNQAMFGSLSPQEKRKALEAAAFDRNVIQKLERSGRELREMIAEEMRQQGFQSDPAALNTAGERIKAKLDSIAGAYLSWRELLFCFISGWAGYHSPVWLLHMQKRMRRMEMKNEVDQFYTLLTILAHFERMSVEHMLEWLERFAVLFQPPLSACLLDYEAGAEEALEKLKEEAAYAPFVRVVERLQAAVNHIPVKQAFDDLEAEQQYHFEQRKQDYERMIETKAGWGRWIGFAPMYALVFLYLVIPLVYMSMQQMNLYYQQIGKIS
ncbi:hypothetical protein [Paenibacillus chitinolyticus]|uniref:hypothetical protein n=1 Tax=Paenibacillus chitinolyticus TaxID=79263 RepID=UPI00210B6813|nr:hypothetical protein [Paenibacillus chitinolyticus]